MRVALISVLLFAIAVWPALGQTAPKVRYNVSVSESTIWACYPGMASFHLSICNGNVTIFRTQQDDTESSSTYPATIKKLDERTYRAEFGANSWLELDIVSGTTTLFHKGKTEAFFTPASTGK